MTRGPEPRAITAATALAAAVLLTGLTGCNGDSQAAQIPSTSSTPTSATPTQTPTEPDPQTVAKEAALAAYAGYRRLYDDAAQKADDKVIGMEKYARGPALSQARLAMHSDRIQGVVSRGRYASSPQVTEVLLDQAPKRVVLTDCVDGTAVKLVNRRTGKSIQIVDPQGRPTNVRRHPGLAWVEWVSGGWFVTRAYARPEKAC